MRHHRLIRKDPRFLRIAMALMLAAGLCAPIYAQVNLEIGAGCTLETTGVMNLELSGNWTNAGTFVAGNGTVTFNGSNGTQTIVNASGETFHDLTVNKVAGIVQLMSPINVNGTATLTSGDLNLNGNVLTLGPSASVSETAGNTIYCGTTGYVIAVRSLNGPSAENVAGLGIVISTSADLGSTTVKRSHAVLTGGGNSSIKRSFTVVPTNNSGLNATLVFRYDHSELNGLTESELTLFRSTDDGATWVGVGGTLDTANNAITLSGIGSFSTWTAAASSAPLPVQLASFVATTKRLNVQLRWTTATETDNHGFEIERRGISDNHQSQMSQLTGWNVVGFVRGSGTSASPKEYSFTDKLVTSGRYAYRIKQTDDSRQNRYSQSVEIDVGVAPRELTLCQNYPNPFNPSTSIEYTLAVDGYVTLRIYDVVGREVATLVGGENKAGYIQKATFDGSKFPSGVYLARLQSGGRQLLKKLLLLK